MAKNNSCNSWLERHQRFSAKSELLQAFLPDDLLRALGIGGAEDEDAFAGEEEGVHVGNVDVGCCKDGQDAGCLARLVLELDCKDIGKRDGHALFAQNDVGTLRVVANDAVDAEVLCVGNGGGDYLDACSFEHVEHGKQCATLVLDKDG